MRGLLAILILGVSMTASAGSSKYEIFVQACDGGTDCIRVVDVSVTRDGISTEINNPGINLRIDALSADAETTTVRLTMSLAPGQMVRASMGTRKDTATKVGFQIEPCTLRKGQFGILGTFSGSGKIYQVWGRLAPDASPDPVLASR